MTRTAAEQQSALTNSQRASAVSRFLQQASKNSLVVEDTSEADAQIGVARCFNLRELTFSVDLLQKSITVSDEQHGEIDITELYVPAS